MTDENVILKVAEIKQIQRGGGVVTTPLVTPHSRPGAGFTTGMSIYPVGQGAPLHKHNCDEQVTLLEGEGRVEINGESTPLVKYDSTYIKGGDIHAFYNTGTTPMRILWIYASNRVTRTFAGSTEEVEHLSAKDLMG
jgi:mannose-6-phosphate isomerase-like protein (cupin superfamily)